MLNRLLFAVPGLFLNDLPCSPTENAHSKHLLVGAMEYIHVKLTNNSPTAIPVSFLVLEPYTFSQEGRSIVRNLSGWMLHSDNLVTSVPKVGWGWGEEGDGRGRMGMVGGGGWWEESAIFAYLLHLSLAAVSWKQL